eukprot:TRINITY_DN4477_c0_g2_i2.p1 TRINITY_DN4477_c0_g2~~TRINITY_DN4477_c0_g2_i2.p1  ORF type:complete len:197 (+),score=22.07 TRINITY_DN4477_c0_g2_i2:228-818(+)
MPPRPLRGRKLVPRTLEYLEGHMFALPDTVKAVFLKWGSRGSGHTGARHFFYKQVPPMMYANQGLKFGWYRDRIQKDDPPSLTLQFKDNSIESYNIRSMKDHDVLDLLQRAAKKDGPKDKQVAVPQFSQLRDLDTASDPSVAQGLIELHPEWVKEKAKRDAQLEIQAEKRRAKAEAKMAKRKNKKKAKKAAQSAAS